MLSNTEIADLTGTNYYKILDQIHTMLRPKTYFEIGVNTGDSLALARCAAIGVDPGFRISDPDVFKKLTELPACLLFKMGSDDFFRQHDPQALLKSPIEFAFLDGMHRCEYLLRDFMNMERHVRKNAIVALHDCLPVDVGITSRDVGGARSAVSHRVTWWTGDVWKTSLLLKRHRPDLKMLALDAAPSGLVLISNLDPQNTYLQANYKSLVEEMMAWSLADIGIENLFAEMGVTSTNDVKSHSQLTGHFWL